MSKCISRHGEYSDCVPDQNFLCERCLVVDETAILAVLARVRVLADQYAATAEVHTKVRDTMPDTEVNIRLRLQARALAGMAQHHADQLHAALEPK